MKLYDIAAKLEPALSSLSDGCTIATAISSGKVACGTPSRGFLSLDASTEETASPWK